MERTGEITQEEVHAELERILASEPFANSHRSQRFLRYVVEATFANVDESLKEFAIAVDVFGRNTSYDPSVDATVRVEAGRLRSRLREYYSGAGKADPIIIEIPKGAYRANFVANPNAVSAMPASVAEASLGPWRKPALVVMLAALLLIAIVTTTLLLNKRAPAPAARGTGEIVLAVLPFSNQTGSESNSYLTEGITQTLIRQFSQLPQVRVISRAAVDHINRQNATSQYEVGYLLNGALVHNSDGHLVLNAELSNAKDGSVLASRQYIPDEADLRPIQADIVQDVEKGLGIQLNAKDAVGAQQPLTSSPVAFGYFLRGETSIRRRDDPGNLHRAIQDFEEAVRLDPSFALAYSSLAEAHLELGIYYESPLDHMEPARRNAQLALSLDPSIQQAHGILGLIALLYDWNLPHAQNELAQADTRENAIWSLGCTAHLLAANGRYRHAEEDIQRMLEFDPESSMLVSELGCVKYYAGQYDDSIRFYRRAMAIDSQSVLGYWGLGRVLAKTGRYKEALQTLRTFKPANGIEPPIITAEIGYTEGVSGDKRSAEQTISQLKEQAKKIYVDPYLIAVIYLSLGDRDSTYAWLNKAYDVRSPFLISLASDPKWSEEASNAHLRELWNRMTQAHSLNSTHDTSAGAL
ncbi:MAG TPA: tetratricopeptide repeat protein [Terracidiphilus sp.]|jgi:tetratricopeptide (TPR) repeat protein